MVLENILSQEIVQKLGWTLLHFVWQAAAVALLLGILLALLRKSSASMRYIIACAAMGLIILLPIVTMLLIPISTPQPIAEIEPAPPPVVLHVEPVDQTPLTRELEYMEMDQPENVETATPVNWKQQASELLESSLPYLVLGWLLGVFGLSLWHLGGWAQLQRLREKMVKQVDDSLSATMYRLSDRLGVKRAVQLLESALVQVPTVVGWLRPVILLPASAMTGLTTEQLEALLAHELAHVRRYDYLVNMLQTVVETLGFYHPAVWWVSHRIRIERENCCDDLAISISGDRIRYARALTSMEEIRSGRSELAVAATGGNLFGRIRRLVSNDSTDSSRASWIPSAITILLIAIIAMSARLAISTPSKSQEPEKKTEIAGDAEKKQSVRVDNFTSTTVGPIGPSALLFDGVDDCLRVPASPTLELKPPFTIEMWVKPDFSEGEKIKASGEDFYGLSLLRKGNKLKDEGKQVGGLAMLLHPSRVGSVYFVDDNISIAVQTSLFGGDGSALTAHPGWLHISASCTREEYIPVPDETLFIGGAIEPPFLPPFKGQIAEIRIWNRLFTRSNPSPYKDTALTGSEPNLVACWDFEHSEGQIVYDISPNTNHAYMGTSPDADDADPIRLSPDTIPDQANRKIDAPVENKKGSIKGRIIDINTGKGIAAVQLSAVSNSSPESNERFTCTTAEDGTFAIGGLQSSEYLLQGDFPSVDVDVISGRCTKDVLIGIDRREIVPSLKETTIEQQNNGQIVIGARVIKMPADAMKEAFGPNENFSSGLLVRHGHEIAGRLLTIERERKDAKLLAAPQMLLNNNSNGTIALIKEEFFIHHYEPVEGEPGKLAPQLQHIQVGWKFKIYAKILEGGEKVHIKLATRHQEPGFETRQYRPGYDYQIPPPPDIFATELTAKNSEPVVIGRLRRDETAYCLIVTPSAILPERQPESLLGKKLPEPDNIQNINGLKEAEGKQTLICFWDMNQRPSRNLIDELAKREKELVEKDIAVYLIQTSNIEPAKLKEWLENQIVRFACGNIEGEAKEVLLDWGVRAQPWLILTDQNGIVRAEGFNLEQLDEKLQTKESNLSLEDQEAIQNSEDQTNILYRGFVRNEKGDPIAEAKICWFSKQSGGLSLNLSKQWNHPDVLTTDKRGEFMLRNVYGNNIGIYVKAEGYAQCMIGPLELPRIIGPLFHPGDSKKLMQIVLQQGADVFGRVVEDGQSVVGARISANVFTAQLHKMLDSPWPCLTTKTDENGFYRLADLPAGQFSIGVNSPIAKGNLNMAQKTINIERGDKVELNFGDEEGFTLTGVVTVDGEAVEIASVRMQLPDESTKWGWTDHNGNFRITGIPSGRYQLFTTYDKDLDPVTFLWGKDGKQFYDTRFDRRRITMENDTSFDIHIGEQSSSNNLLTKSAAPSSEDRTIVKVYLAVVEVSSDSKMDSKTIAEIRNILGGKITIPDSPAVADLLRKAAGATAASKDKSAGDKRVTQKEFNTLFDLLVSRGYVKIILRPTLEVVDGQTAQIKDEQNLLEVTANAVKDDIIYLSVKADLSSQIAPANEGKKPIISTRSFANFISINSGQSQIIGGMVEMPARPNAEGNAKGTQTPVGELICIVTASIVAPNTDTPVTRVYHIYDLILAGERISRGTVDVTMDRSDAIGASPVNIPDQEIVNEARKIINLITQTIDPNSWFQNNPNAIGIITPFPAASPRKLAIYQTVPVHKQIEKLLESQRDQINKTQISIELCYLYTNVEFLDEARDSMDIEFTSDTFLDDKQLETLLRASQKKINIKSLMAPVATVLNNETARFSIAKHIFMSFLGYSESSNLSKQSPPEPVNTFCSITPHIEDNKDIIIDFIQDIPGLQERIIYDRREMVQSYAETTAITNKRIPSNKTFAFICDIRKFDQDNQTVSPAEKKTLIVLIKPTIIVQEEMPRKEPSRMLIIPLMKGDMANQFDDTVFHKPLPEEQPGKEAKEPPADNQQDRNNIKDEDTLNKEYEVIQLNHIDAVNAANRLKQALQQTPELHKSVLFQPLEQTQQIIIFGKPDMRKKIKKLLAEIDQQVEHSEKLSKLGKALLIYANNHDGKYPDSIAQVKQYLKTEEFAWAQQNVTYYGKGRTVADPPDMRLARDNRQAVATKGTNILFNDGRVEFIKPGRQKDRGTDKDQILIDVKILTAGDEFLKYIGLDPNSAASSEGWSDYLIHSTDDSASFIIDKLHADLLLRNVAARMRTNKDIKMLHKPQVLAQSRKKLEIHITESEYYMLIAPTEPNDSSEEPESKSNRVELGTTIRMIPTLTPDGKNIELDFEWEYRRLRGIMEHTGPDGNVQKVPQIDVNSIKTPCTVPDGKTLLIAGKKITEHKKKEPRKLGLTDLPLIGRFFYRPSQVDETRNLLILVKPRINPFKKEQAQHTIEPPSIDPNDPLIKKLEEKFNRYDEKKQIITDTSQS